MVKKREKGQSIILIVIALVGLIAMAALMVDGGNAYFNRRDAQTAADAGALRGAYEYCVNNNPNITPAVQNFVEVQNGATLISATYDSDTDEIVVVTEKTQGNFFAKIFGLSTTKVSATASAGCFPPGAVDSVIPVAWSCRPPVEGTASDSEDCEWKSIPYNTFEDIKTTMSLQGKTFTGADGTLLYFDDETPEDENLASEYLDTDSSNESLQLYVIMNSVPLSGDVVCEPPDADGVMGYCDLDGDGRIDWTNSERSWLLLDENDNDGNQLTNIVKGVSTFGMTTPGWYPGESGNKASVYGAAVTYIEGTYALIPVFEEGQICAGYVYPENDCPLYVENDYVMHLTGNDPETYFRVITFAEFYVSCVSDKPGKKCPGKQAVIDFLNANGESSAAKDYANEMGIEGYFIDGWVSNNPDIAIGSNAIDLGVYVLSLTD